MAVAWGSSFPAPSRTSATRPRSKKSQSFMPPVASHVAMRPVSRESATPVTSAACAFATARSSASSGFSSRSS